MLKQEDQQQLKTIYTYLSNEGKLGSSTDVMISLGVPFGKTYVKLNSKRFKKLDQSGNSTKHPSLKKLELLWLIDHVTYCKQEVQVTFDYFDADQDGSITIAEIMRGEQHTTQDTATIG